MPEFFRTPLLAVLSVYLVMIVGIVCRRTNRITQESSQTVIQLVVNLLLPCLIISKIVSNRAFDDPRNLFLPPICGFLMVAFGIIVATLFLRCVPKRWTGLMTPEQRRTFIACVGTVNYGYVPIPLIIDLFPGDQNLLAVLFMQNIGIELAMWTLCIFVFLGSFDRKTVRSVINVPTIAIVGSVLLNIFALDRFIPALVLKPIDLIGSCAIPVSLLFVGAAIADYFDWDYLKKEWKSLGLIGVNSSFLRLIILPAIIILAAKYLPCTTEHKTVLVIHGAMASAMFPIVLSGLYNGNVKTAMGTVLSNSLLSIITTPLWIAIGLHLIAS